MFSREFFSKTIWLFGEKIGKVLFTFVVITLIARYLGPEMFGEFNYAQAFVTLFVAFASLGMDNVIIRDLVKNPDAKLEIIITSFVMKVVASIITFIFSNLLVFIFIESTLIQGLIFIFSFSYLINSLNVVELYFQSQAIVKIPVSSKLISMFTIATLNLILIFYYEASIELFAITLTLESLIIYSLMFIFYLSLKKKKKIVGSEIKNNFSVSRSRKLLSDSWPLILSSLSIVVYMKIDQIMIGNISGSYELGIYSVAVRLAEIWYFIPTIIISPLVPSLIQYKEDSLDQFYRKIDQLLSVLIGLAVCIAIFNGLFADYIVSILYGENYIGSANILVLYTWIGIFVNIGLVKSLYLNIYNYPKIQLAVSLIGCLLNVILNWILIPFYGAFGATIASLISYWVQAHGALFLFPQTKEFAFTVFKSILYMPIAFFKRTKTILLKK